MDTKKYGPWISIAVIACALCVYFFLLIRKHAEEPPPPPLEGSYLEATKRRSGPCPGEVKDLSFEGKKFTLTVNWYECHAVEKNDLVYYQFSPTDPAVVRRVIAAPGDRFQLSKDDKKHAWTISVNQKLALNTEAKPIFFGNSDVPTPPLSLYLHEGVGELKAREAIVFSDDHAGSLDSGMFGVVNADDFLGKIEAIK